MIFVVIFGLLASSVPLSYAKCTCSVAGDPHITTCDAKTAYAWQGVGLYSVFKTSDLEVQCDLDYPRYDNGTIIHTMFSYVNNCRLRYMSTTGCEFTMLTGSLSDQNTLYLGDSKMSLVDAQAFIAKNSLATGIKVAIDAANSKTTCTAMTQQGQIDVSIAPYEVTISAHRARQCNGMCGTCDDQPITGINFNNVSDVRSFAARFAADGSSVMQPIVIKKLGNQCFNVSTPAPTNFTSAPTPIPTNATTLPTTAPGNMTSAPTTSPVNFTTPPTTSPVNGTTAPSQSPIPTTGSTAMATSSPLPTNGTTPSPTTGNLTSGTTSMPTTGPATTAPAPGTSAAPTTGPATTGPATPAPAPGTSAAPTTGPATTGPATTGPATTGPATTGPATTAPAPGTSAAPTTGPATNGSATTAPAPGTSAAPTTGPANTTTPSNGPSPMPTTGSSNMPATSIPTSGPGSLTPTTGPMSSTPTTGPMATTGPGNNSVVGATNVPTSGPSAIPSSGPTSIPSNSSNIPTTAPGASSLPTVSPAATLPPSSPAPNATRVVIPNDKVVMDVPVFESPKVLLAVIEQCMCGHSKSRFYDDQFFGKAVENCIYDKAFPGAENLALSNMNVASNLIAASPNTTQSAPIDMSSCKRMILQRIVTKRPDQIPLDQGVTYVPTWSQPDVSRQYFKAPFLKVRSIQMNAAGETEACTNEPVVSAPQMTSAPGLLSFPSSAPIM